MKSYEQIRAPFDGVIRARFVDKGVLAQNSTTNKTSNQPIMTIADETNLRADVRGIPRGRIVRVEPRGLMAACRGRMVSA